MGDTFDLELLVIPVLAAEGGTLAARHHPAGLRVAIAGAIGVLLAALADAGQSVGMASLLATVMAAVVLICAVLAAGSLVDSATRDRSAAALTFVWSLAGGLLLLLMAGFWLFSGVQEPGDFADPLAWLGAMLMPLAWAVPLWPWRGRRAGWAIVAASTVVVADALVIGAFVPWRAAGLAVATLWVVACSDGGRPRRSAEEDVVEVIVAGTGTALLAWIPVCAGLVAYWAMTAGP
jgi:hypothetical protein